MSSTLHQSMHTEHLEWAGEIGLWRDNLRLWQHDVDRMQNEVQELTLLLKGHDDALRSHASHIRQQEQSFESHEHALAEYERGAEGDELLQMARQHGEEASRQQKQRDDHEGLKRAHHEVLRHWSALLKALHEHLPPEKTRSLGPETAGSPA
jgi:hypothetical protein